MKTQQCMIIKIMRNNKQNNNNMFKTFSKDNIMGSKINNDKL